MVVLPEQVQVEEHTILAVRPVELELPTVLQLVDQLLQPIVEPARVLPERTLALVPSIETLLSVELHLLVRVHLDLILALTTVREVILPVDHLIIQVEDLLPEVQVLPGLTLQAEVLQLDQDLILLAVRLADLILLVVAPLADPTLQVEALLLQEVLL